MQEIIARCGLPCNECEAYIATINNDEAEITRVAAEWSEKYGAEIGPADVWCEGCHADSGHQSSYCKNFCAVKKCAVEKEVENCGHCREFVCATLQDFLNLGLNVPEYKDRMTAAKTRLETIHAQARE